MAYIIIKRICFIMASMIWGTMMSMHYIGKYISSSPEVLKYDNAFILFFGVFLIAYAYELHQLDKTSQNIDKKNWPKYITSFALLYVLADTLENLILLHLIPVLINLDIVNFFKFSAALTALIWCLYKESFQLQRGKQVLWGVLYSLFYMFFAFLVFQVTNDCRLI